MLISLNQIISSNKKCLFCDKKLNIILSNFIGFKNNGNPILFSKLDHNIFKFNLFNRDNAVKCSLNVKTGILTFYKSNQDSDCEFFKNFFEKLCPHLELYCNNKKCSQLYQYYLSTDVFKFDHTKIKNKFKIKKFKLYMESFTINDFWIQNDWIRNDLNIFKKDNPDTNSITYNCINFSNLSSDKIKQKIITLVSFS